MPLQALEWPDFESLQWRILRDVEGLRHAQIYGDPGQAQLGLDIVAIAADESVVALQSKRVQQLGPAAISAAVNAFLCTGPASARPPTPVNVGVAQADWAKLSLTPWIYPVGSGLSLHQDGSAYTGAFTFFVHPEWRLDWGGHLLVLDSRTRSRKEAQGEHVPPFLDDRQETARAFDPGFALTVLPKPNRIAFLSPRALHLLTRVDANAGQAARTSIARFFHRGDSASSS